MGGRRSQPLRSRPQRHGSEAAPAAAPAARARHPRRSRAAFRATISHPRDHAAWTLPRLRQYLVRAGVVPGISLEPLRVTLQKAGLSLKTARPDTADPKGDHHDDSGCV